MGDQLLLNIILVQNFRINIIYNFTHEITIFSMPTFPVVTINAKKKKMTDEDNLSPRIFIANQVVYS